MRLALDSRPESLIVVRAMLAGLAEAAGIEPARFDDLRTAVSEACSNVVLHAYDEETGPLEVALELDTAALRIRVLDRGRGIRQIVSAGGGRMRVGLALISALADRAEVLGRDGGGTEVRMSFPGVRALSGAPGPLPALWASEHEGGLAAEGVIAEIAPVELVEGIVGRIAAALAAQASFTVDRHADVRIVCDEIGAFVRATRGLAGVICAARPAPRQLELELGPLPPGSWERFRTRRAGRPDTVLERLSDEVSAQSGEDGETLLIGLSDPRPGRGDRPSEPDL